MGSGFKTFTAGSVLTASDVQNYLQDQAVMVFGGTAARSSAIGTANFEEGMLTYLTDVDKLQVYTGATFEDVYPAAASNQGLTLINTTSFSGVASQNLTAIFSSTYDNYCIVISELISSTDAVLRARLGAGGTPNSSSTYDFGSWVVNNGGLNAAISGITQTSFTINEIESSANFTMGEQITIFQPNKTTYTTINFQGYDQKNGRLNVGSGGHLTASAMTDFEIFPSTGTITGKVSVYGYNK